MCWTGANSHIPRGKRILFSRSLPLSIFLSPGSSPSVQAKWHRTWSSRSAGLEEEAGSSEPTSCTDSADRESLNVTSAASCPVRHGCQKVLISQGLGKFSSHSVLSRPPPHSCELLATGAALPCHQHNGRHGSCSSHRETWSAEDPISSV